MHPTEKTTLSDLLAGTSPQVQALIANSIDETIDLGDQPTTLTTPRVGDYWRGQGGLYAGIMRDRDHQWHLIDSGQFIIAAWGNYPNEIAGEISRRDGQHNTNLILAAEPDNEIAAHSTALLIDGHKDFYWPSQYENNLLLANIPEHLSQEWHWSSTQYSAHFAWSQHFADGTQNINNKNNRFAARAVRRILII